MMVSLVGNFLEDLLVWCYWELGEKIRFDG